MYNSVGKWLVIPSARTASRQFSLSNRCNESRQRFERLLVLDFEATCDSQRGTIRPQVYKTSNNNSVVASSFILHGDDKKP